jgi:hypothetical protein
MFHAPDLLGGAFSLAVLMLPGACAHAGITSPMDSDVDPYLVACPAGDIVFHTVMRDLSHNPQDPGTLTTLGLCGCPGVVLADPQPGDLYWIDQSCIATADIQTLFGDSDFALRAGGICSGATIEVRSGGVLVAVRTSFASPDQDGSQVVDVHDRDLLTAKIALGAYDPTGDLDGNGALDGADLAMLEVHLGHTSLQPVPVAASSWGRIKTLYR